jgi:hypothetical protein
LAIFRTSSASLNTHGGLGKRAKEFIRRLGIYSVDHATTVSSVELMSGLHEAIGCANQRDNALVMQTGDVRSTSALNKIVRNRRG